MKQESPGSSRGEWSTWLLPDAHLALWRWFIGLPSDAQEVTRGVARRGAALVAQDAPVAKGDLPFRVSGDVGLVRHQQDRDAMLVQRLEHRHDLKARAAIQVPSRLVS